MRIAKQMVAFLTLGGMLIPPAAWGINPQTTASPEIEFDPTIRDVSLTPHGQLQARIMTRSGVAVADRTVELSQAGMRLATLSSDESGNVAIPGLRGGQYELRLGNRLSQIRVWTHQAAPPVATNELLLIADENVTRAQQPLSSFLCQEPVMIAVLVAAAIAIPIAVHDSGS